MRNMVFQSQKGKMIWPICVCLCMYVYTHIFICILYEYNPPFLIFILLVLLKCQLFLPMTKSLTYIKCVKWITTIVFQKYYYMWSKGPSNCQIRRESLTPSVTHRSFWNLTLAIIRRLWNIYLRVLPISCRVKSSSRFQIIIIIDIKKSIELSKSR